jgi:tetratricopeptide (TPR) repeat protein
MRRLVLLLVFASTLAAAEPERGKLVENVAARNDATQTYTLYLPSSYDAAKKYPALVILDPRGRGTVAAKVFRPAAEEYGWILVSSNQTRSDGEWEPNVKALRAIMPDVTSRYATDPRRIYATGFSGTAMVAWHLGITTGALAGVIGVGGRNIPDMPPEKFNFAHYGFSGDEDFNNRDMRDVEAILDREHQVPHRFASFPGTHQWIGVEEARAALGWMELVAMADGKRPRDEALIERLYAADVAAAAALEAAGRRVDALQRYRDISRTFESLHDVSALRRAIARLTDDPAVAREREETAKWAAFEQDYVTTVLSRIPQLFATIRGQHLPPVPTFTQELRIADLQKRATRPGLEGTTARRLLEAVFGQFNAYLPKQLFERHEYALALALFTVARNIHDDRPNNWYNLATAHARLGQTKKALDALEKAISLGWTDRTAIANDEDFTSLRKEPRFKKLTAK